MRAVIPAAGLGTRFLPHTKAQPKEMMPVVDKPAIQYVVEEAVSAGVRDILIVTGKGKRVIEDHFDANVELDSYLARTGRLESLEELRQLMGKIQLMYVRQPEPKGLGDAVLHAEPFVEGQPFLVLLGDDITLNPPCAQVLLAAHRRLGGTVVALQEVPRADIGRYGMAVGKDLGDGLMRIEDVVEKPRPGEVRSHLATIGRYVLTTDVFDALRAAPAGAGGELQLTDGIRRLLAQEDVHGVIYRGTRYDVGDRVGWLTANIELALQREDLRDGLLAQLQSVLRGTQGPHSVTAPTRRRTSKKAR